MVSPALILIFTFGIFPVLFAVYVSLHKWKIKQGDFLGLKNFVNAVDNFAYLLFFAVCLGFVYIVYRSLKDIFETAKERQETPWILAVPAALHAAAGLLFVRWVVLLLPEVLAIADLIRKISTQDRTTEIYLQLFKDALNVETVAAASKQWWLTWIIAWVLTAAAWRLLKAKNINTYLPKFVNAWFFAASAVITAWFTVSQIQAAIQQAFDTGEEVDIWVHLISISAGVIALYIAWRLWKSAVDQISDKGFIWRALAAVFFIIGGWLLIAEIPATIQAGDKDLWLGLKVTAFYSMGTIPFQLSISLVLAFLLFQNIRGKEFFRILFFLPYITPAVASAAVFRLLFSARPTAAINSVLSAMGFETQKWLIQPRGIFTILAESLGIENFPEWAAGPSEALVVVIMYSIWVYVGYDVVIYLAGLGNISNEINEAAEIDGASRWQIMRHITLPLLSPTIYFLSLIAVIGTFKAFNHIFIMRDSLALGTIDTFSVAIFDEFFTRTRFGYASAMAFVLFAVILALTYINNKVQGSRVFYG
jgi:multiple sugar transport system permease protein